CSSDLLAKQAPAKKAPAKKAPAKKALAKKSPGRRRRVLPEPARAAVFTPLLTVDEPIEPREPLPVAAEVPGSDPADSAGEMVEGILCSRHHLNNPDARF